MLVLYFLTVTTDDVIEVVQIEIHFVLRRIAVEVFHWTISEIKRNKIDTLYNHVDISDEKEHECNKYNHCYLLDSIHTDAIMELKRGLDG